MVATQARLLAAAGHDVELHELENPAGSRAAATALVKAPWNSAAARSVVLAADRFRPDVVHVHNTWFALSPAVFSKLKAAGHPTVATIHNYRPACVNALFYRDGGICEDCLGRGPWRGVAHACYRDSRLQSAAVAVTIDLHRRLGTWHDHVDVVIALTQFAAGKLAVSGVPADRMVVIPNVVSDPGPRTIEPASSRTVLFVGRLTEDKGILDLIEAWRLAGSSLQLDVLGDGPLRQRVEAMAGGTVRIYGSRSPDEVREAMLGSRALILPSRWYEGLPMVLVEAMAAGLAVVVPRHGAMAEVAGEGALVYEGADVRTLAALLSGLESAELVAGLAAASRARFEDRFTPEHAVGLLENAYQLARSRNSTGR